MDVASLELQLIGTSDKAVAAIEKLTAALGALKSSVNIGSSASLKKLGANVTTLAESINKLDPKSVDALKVMGDALNGLTGAGKISSTLAKQVSELGKSIKELDDASIERIARLSAGLAPLAGINIQAFPKELDATTTSSKKSALSLAFLTTKFAALSYMYKKTASLLGPLITKSNEYVENLNLFTVTMGKAAGAAQDFAEKVSATVGIDTSEWIRTQGIFMALASGFGIASDSAAVMSQQLTQLAYDASSFFNLPFSESITKFQSAFAGEIEPVRRLGYDLNVTRLQQEAYALGIEKTVHNMTQAEKAALRYYALMKQNTIVQGDMARTLIAPANQLRVLQAQFSMLARELGNIFIPALNAILPTAIAVATALRMIAKEIASFFGYELPEIDYSGIQTLSSGAEDAEDALGGAAANAKKLKDYVMGIDELNIISPQEDSGGGAAGGGEDVLGKIPVETYDFLKDLKARSDEIAKGIKEEFEKMLPIIASIGAGLAVALAASKFIKWIGDVKSLSAAFNAVKDKVSALRTAIGIGFVVGGITLGALTGLDIAENGLNYSNILKSVGAVLAGGFGMKLLSTALGIGGLMGFGLGASIVLAIEGVTLSASAGYKIGYNGFDPDLFKRMIGGNIATILGLTVAGGLIAGVPGALVGLAGGILITLTADILAIDIGKHEKLKENINAQIFNNIGAITIPEITVPVENVMLDLLGSINADEIIANQGKMDMLTESIGSQRVRVDELMRAWQDGSITSQQAIDGLTDTVGTMVSQSMEKLDLLKNNLLLSLSPAFLAYAESMGLTIAQGEQLISKTLDPQIEKVKEAEKSFNALNAALKAGTISQSEYNKEFLEITGTFDSVNGYMNEAGVAIEGLKMKFSSLNLGSSEAEVSSVLSSFSSTFTTTMEKAQKAGDDIVKNWAEAKRLFIADGFTEEEANAQFGQWLEAQQGFAEQNKITLEKDFLEPYDQLKVGLVGKIAEAMTTASSEWDKEFAEWEKKDWREKLTNPMIPKDESVRIAGQEAANQLKKILDPMEAELDARGIEFGEKGSEISQNLVDGLFQTVYLEGSINTFGHELDSQTIGMLESYGINVNDLAQGLGRELPENYSQGVKGSISENVNKTQEELEKIQGSISGASNTLNPLAVESGVGLVDRLKSGVETQIAINHPLIYSGFKALGLGAVSALSSNDDAMYAAGGALSEGALAGASEKQNSLSSLWSSWAGQILNWFNIKNEIDSPSKLFKQSGEWIAQGVYDGASEKQNSLSSLWSSWSGQVINWFRQKNDINSPSALFAKLGGYISEGVYEGATDKQDSLASGWMSWAGQISDWFNGANDFSTTDSSIFLASGQAIAQGVADGLRSSSMLVLDVVTSITDQSVKLLKDSIVRSNNELSTFSEDLGIRLYDWKMQASYFFGYLVDSFTASWNNIVIIVDNASSLIVEDCNRIASAANAAAEAIRSLQTLQGAGGGFSFSASGFASGGFPSMGELFLARENGPELVGAINGQTAVANNDQIVESIRKGVYEAVAAALSIAQPASTEQNSGGNFNLYIDGKQVTAAVERVQRERGLSLLGT